MFQGTGSDVGKSLIGDGAATRLAPSLRECTRFVPRVLQQSEAERKRLAETPLWVVVLDIPPLCHPSAVATIGVLYLFWHLYRNRFA